MTDSVTEARKRQISRLDGARPPTARKAMALAKSKAYQDGADAEATLRAYTTDVANFEAGALYADIGMNTYPQLTHLPLPEHQLLSPRAPGRLSPAVVEPGALFALSSTTI